MLRHPAAPSTARPASFDWPERWKQQVQNAVGPGAGAREMQEAKRMGGTLAGMLQKELPTINSSAKSSK